MCGFEVSATALLDTFGRVYYYATNDCQVRSPVPVRIVPTKPRIPRCMGMWRELSSLTYQSILIVTYRIFYYGHNRFTIITIYFVREFVFRLRFLPFVRHKEADACIYLFYIQPTHYSFPRSPASPQAVFIVQRYGERTACQVPLRYSG